MIQYAEFLEHKAQLGGDDGFVPEWMPDFLFDFQRDLVEWAARKGRAAIFADCGLGKTPMQLVWAENVRRHTGGAVLILTPLAVSHQTQREAEKFGIECGRAAPGVGGITVTNYERLHHLDWRDYAGVVCDESSILKSFSGKRRAEITAFMRKLKYRLLCTATAAPNDYHELGTSSEALGEFGYMDMLGKFFRNDQNSGAVGSGRSFGGQVKWRLKGHAEEPFWRWVCSWARAVRRPSDLGYDDGRFTLPPLDVRENLVENTMPLPGYLFHVPAKGLDEQRQELRATINERCEKVAALLDHDQPALAWCHANAEGDLMEKLIPGAVQVSGSDKDEDKEEKLLGFADGKYRVLVTKPRIGAFGLNFQHCAHHSYFPSHSFEQWYQAVRRSWRFGQQRPVTVDIVTTPGEEGVLQNLHRKAAAADQMFDRLVHHMRETLRIERGIYQPTKQTEIPSWL